MQKNGAIQILRGGAAILVVIAHFSASIGDYYTGSPITFKTGLVELGNVGVSVFFFISGFIMMQTTINKSWGWQESIRFIKKRFIRIYPLYWLWTSILLILWLVGLALKSHDYTFMYVLKSYILIPTISSGDKHPLLSPGWTLVFEMFFYVTLFICIAFDLKKHVIIYILMFFSLMYFSSDYFSDAISYIVSSYLIFQFVFGMISWTIFNKYKGVLDCYQSKFTVISVFVFIMLVSVTLAGKSYNNIFIFIVMFVLILTTSLSKYSNSKYTVFFEFLGDASYSIYLVHYIFSLLLSSVLKKGFFQSINPIVLLCTSSLVVTVICLVSYVYIEKPIVNFFNSHGKYKKSQAESECGV
ncbi:MULTISPECIES: acyltransferase [unclassified Serratia (in: enterobacteria)]|uniref:acyltransferase family protein n=1 Tax=unclassified Serratia (in: enterobacteria) TaxID=2647522 RepID=UPI00046AF791|nr:MULTISPECIES: acyltransferase [unclassified Serratia (in: enterobacteria)]